MLLRVLTLRTELTKTSLFILTSRMVVSFKAQKINKLNTALLLTDLFKITVSHSRDKTLTEMKLNSTDSLKAKKLLSVNTRDQTINSMLRESLDLKSHSDDYYTHTLL